MLAKTIVVSPERVISIKIGKIGRHNAYLSVDGGRAFRLNTERRHHHEGFAEGDEAGAAQADELL